MQKCLTLSLFFSIYNGEDIKGEFLICYGVCACNLKVQEHAFGALKNYGELHFVPYVRF